MYARIHRFGPEFQFLTIAFDNVNSPQVFHLTFSQPDNTNFPCIADTKFLSSMEEGTPFTSGNVKIPTKWSALATAVTKTLLHLHSCTKV